MSECAICGGAQEEHGPAKTQHAYTETPGELKSHRQVQQEQAKPGPTFMVPPQSRAEEKLDRLVRVLVANRTVSATQAYGILTGHFVEEDQFADPMDMMRKRQ